MITFHSYNLSRFHVSVFDHPIFLALQSISHQVSGPSNAPISPKLFYIIRSLTSISPPLVLGLQAIRDTIVLIASIITQCFIPQSVLQDPIKLQHLFSSAFKPWNKNQLKPVELNISKSFICAMSRLAYLIRILIIPHKPNLNPL